MDAVATVGAPPQSVTGPGITTVLTIIIPTLNERENIEPLVALLSEALPDTAWEAIIVDDDSRDGTSEHVRTLARCNPRVRCLQRIGRRGLATACIEGVRFLLTLHCGNRCRFSARRAAVAVHVGSARKPDPRSRNREPLRARRGFRRFEQRPHPDQRIATRLAHFICKAEIADPLSGLFMCRPQVFKGALRHMSGQRFKVLLDLLVAGAIKGARSPTASVNGSTVKASSIHWSLGNTGYCSPTSCLANSFRCVSPCSA